MKNFSTDGELPLTVVVAAAMAIGALGTVLPLLPGVLLIWFAALCYGLILGFGATGYVVMAILSVLLLLSMVKSVLLPRRAAADAGASGWAQLGAGLGAVVGLFTIPIVGVVVGALSGAIVVELLIKKRLSVAWQATLGLAKGFGLSAAVDLLLAGLMISVWGFWAWRVLAA